MAVGGFQKPLVLIIFGSFLHTKLCDEIDIGFPKPIQYIMLFAAVWNSFAKVLHCNPFFNQLLNSDLHPAGVQN
jgi:hypothetical protein